ncbi:MAG TPA: serine/threonine-protein kinase [Streptosporangiaceae bacterium]|nr:serine/threonine-protein kinase [Streptosporangiaceae bacterium]
MGYAGLQPEDPREIGPYKLLGQLGSGGMGQVFLGMSAGGRPIAVKIIKTELATDPDFRARFRREVAAAQKVSGLFTALVVDADLDCPMPWLATAYVAGPSLTEAVRGHGPLPVRSLLALTAGLAEGLGAIHKAGVVHRDLKPSNVLLAEDGPRVIDFGISGAAEASAAAAAGESVMIGSPGYMSPEQVLGYDIGLASDMFSLGAVLTFAATGQGPFGSGSPGALMYRLVNAPAKLDDVPAELRPLVGRCLAKHPGDRPTAGELLAEVGALQPAPGWLAESIMNSFAQTQSAAAPAELAEIVAPTGTTSAVIAPPAPPASPRRGGRPGPGGPGRPGRPGRHRISRPLASAGLTAGVVVGSAVATFALIGANRTPAAGHDRPQASAGSPATAPALGAASPVGSSAPPKASLSPSAFLSPPGSRFSTSLAPTPISATQPGSVPASSTPAQPGGSGPGSGSGQPTKSSPPSSSPPSSSAPPSSDPPSSDPPSSPPPSSDPPSSPPPSSDPPSSPPPSSDPPSTTPPSSDPATTPASATPSSNQTDSPAAPSS